jgi:tetratricopeptide (TPR) repeat protein
MSTGNIEKLEECSNEARTVSLEIGDLRNEAFALANFGVVYAMKGELSKAFEYCKEATDLFGKLGSKGNQAQAAGNLSQVCVMLGKFKLAEHYATQAVNLAREIGHKPREVMHLESLSVVLGMQGDYQSAILLCKQASDLAAEIKYRDMLSLESSLGILLDKVGFYDEANKLLSDCFPIAHSMEHLIEPVCLSYLSLVQQHIGKAEDALSSAEQAVNLSREKANQDYEANALLHLGFILIDLMRFDEAREALQKSEALRFQLHQSHLATEPEAGLAMIAMQDGELNDAILYVEQILDLLEEHSLDGTDEPMRIYLTCYQVLQAVADPRGDELLVQAHALLMERADKITDDAMRTSYLENVAANREIVETFNQRG